jgi:hypothetical protein
MNDSKYQFKVGQFVLWQKARRNWSTGQMITQQYQTKIKARKISKFGAVLYQGHDGFWFDEVRIVRELTPEEVVQLGGDCA